MFTYFDFNVLWYSYAICWHISMYSRSWIVLICNTASKKKYRVADPPNNQVPYDLIYPFDFYWWRFSLTLSEILSSSSLIQMPLNSLKNFLKTIKSQRHNDQKYFFIWWGAGTNLPGADAQADAGCVWLQALRCSCAQEALFGWQHIKWALSSAGGWQEWVLGTRVL